MHETTFTRVKESNKAGVMFLAGLLSFFLVIPSVGAAKDGGDDEWVHLPNKCEGKLCLLAAFGSQNSVRGPPEAKCGSMSL